MDGARTQFASNKTIKQDRPRQEYISTNEIILYWFTQISWVMSSYPLNKLFKRFHYIINFYTEFTNLSKLQRVYKHLQVTTSTQTSVCFNEYTNLSRLYESQSPSEIKTTQDLKKHSQMREQ